MKPILLPLFLVGLSMNAQAMEAPPPTSLPVENTWRELVLDASGTSEKLEPPFRVVFDVGMEERAEGAAPVAFSVNGYSIALPTVKPPHRARVEFRYEHMRPAPALLGVWVDGQIMRPMSEIEGTAGFGWFVSPMEEAKEQWRMDRDFTLAVRFSTTGQGTLASRCDPKKKWAPGDKALFVRNKKLVFDIGWLGAITSKKNVANGRPQHAVIVSRGGHVSMWLNGELEGEASEFSAADNAGQVFKLGTAAPNFGGVYDGQMESVQFFNSALDEAERTALNSPTAPEPAWAWQGGPASGVDVSVALPITAPGVTVVGARAQPIGKTPHAALIAAWDSASFERGKTIYTSLCITCHGDLAGPGSLPNSPRFHMDALRNGADPFRLWQTLTMGYGMMIPQTQYDDREKYDVIHYLREAFFKEHIPAHYTEITASDFDALPITLSSISLPPPTPPKTPPWLEMDYGPFLMRTIEVAPGNIAFKGIAIRLDSGPGGVSKGRAWMMYEHDTLRMAAAWTGKGFIDWRSIDLDGSHGPWTRLVGDRHFANAPSPGVANPGDESWGDPRPLDRQGRGFGPLPDTWARFVGVDVSKEKPVIHYRVGTAIVRETPSWIEYGATPIFQRHIEAGPSEQDILLRIAPVEENLYALCTPSDAARVEESAGHLVLRIPARSNTVALRLDFSRLDPAGILAMTSARPPLDVALLPDTTATTPASASPVFETVSEVLYQDSTWAADHFPHPREEDMPSFSWMRLTGFDFVPENPDRAAVCTWMGEVWMVDGLSAPPPSKLRWQRIATGLFQPLGLRYRDGNIYVICRDQLAVIEGASPNQPARFLRAFNTDHQVTEHYHEFAMGLQTDAEGNFYYAKSACHAKPAVIPHHGTLLRVSADGKRTDILANGFRAANGVCLNPDGTFYVTDQEGHWTPKNRINLVREGGFYGNWMGYHDQESNADEHMKEPLCWITNNFDRSPAELCWVPKTAAWGALNGSLLNISYGEGKVFVVVPQEGSDPIQGGMIALPLPAFPTGIMRGRFSPADGQLYTCGMYAWAGNRTRPGGFYRVRALPEQPFKLPLSMNADGQTLSLTFSDPLTASDAPAPENINLDAWDLLRSSSYGSRHLNQRRLQVTAVTLSEDAKTLHLTVPELAPTRGASLAWKTPASEQSPARDFLMHFTLHKTGVVLPVIPPEEPTDPPTTPPPAETPPPAGV